MKKFYIAVLLNCSFFSSFSQQPYIGTAGGDGLGQYGYLEKDAVTFHRLFRNTYDNIAYLSARWFVSDNDAGNGNGIEYVYNVFDFPVAAGGDWDPAIGWQCGGDNDGSKRTKDFVADNLIPEWRAGSDCYVSVCAKYCDDSYYPASFNGTTTNGAVGFNERHFQVLDVNTALHVSTASEIPDGNGVCETTNALQVAGSFTIAPGSLTGISLTGLFLKNNGTAIEGPDIPNSALNVYYEPATGAEVYGDGNEIPAGTLSGNWDGNTGDNIFGNASLNIPLAGTVRIYVLLCDFNGVGSVGKTIDFGFINDGISLAPALNSFSKMRINTASISQKNITLPVSFTVFSGIRSKAEVLLKWRTGIVDQGAEFIIQQSCNGIQYSDAGKKKVSDFSQQTGHYQYSLNSNASYFRIVVRYNNISKGQSNTILLKNKATPGLQLLKNPVHNKILLQNSSPMALLFNLQLSDAAGKLVLSRSMLLTQGINTIEIPANVIAPVLLLSLQNKNGSLYNFKIVQE